jgi:hypothetical protein
MAKLIIFKRQALVFLRFSIVMLWVFSSPVFAELQIAKEVDVQACQYLDQVEGFSGYGKKYELDGSG